MFSLAHNSRWHFLSLMLWLVGAATWGQELDNPAQAQRPNVLFILTDDQAVDTLAAWGTWGNDRQVLQTPHLDQLVARGTSFTRAYNMGSYSPAVCVCSRGMLISGRRLWETERLQRERFRPAMAARQLWPQRMQDAGYQTWMSGKWHVDVPVADVFEQVRHVRPGMPGTIATAYQRPSTDGADPWTPWDESLGGYWQGGRHWSEVIADDAEEFLDLARQDPRPFFIYLAFNAPHDPRQSPRDFVERYDPASVPLPKNFLPLNPDYDQLGIGPADPRGLRDEILAPFPRTEAAILLHRREYYAIVTHLDAQIGRILDALERSGRAHNTVVLFTSDHGLAVGRHGLMGKQNMYEHSLRVPFVIAGPGIPAGRILETPIYLQDAMATALELAGADSTEIDFRSILPLIRGERTEQYSEILATYMRDQQRAVIERDWKLIWYPQSGTRRLFHLGRDPLEIDDRSGDPECGEILDRLSELAQQQGPAQER